MLRSICSKLPKNKLLLKPATNNMTKRQVATIHMKFNHKRPKLLVGDWAGTFINHGSDAPIVAFEELCSDEGVNIPRDVIAAGLGLGKWDHMKELRNTTHWVEKKGKATKEDVDVLYHKLGPKMLKVLSIYNNVKPMEETEDALRRLKLDLGMIIAVTTGYDEEQSDQVVKTLKLHNSPLLSLIDYVVPVNKEILGRPYPHGINKIQKLSGISESQLIWKVDDTKKGIEEGENANCGATIGVYGHCFEMGRITDNPSKLAKENPFAYQKAVDNSIKHLKGANFIIPTIAYIPGLIELYCKKDHVYQTDHGLVNSIIIR